MPHLDKLNLIDAMHSAPASMSVCINTDECHGMMQMKQMMMNLVSSFPESEVVPVRHGKWLEYDDTEYFRAKCSLCGNWIDTRHGTNYCPNCGARMDGDGDV